MTLPATPGWRSGQRLCLFARSAWFTFARAPRRCRQNGPVRSPAARGRADQPGLPDDMLADVLPALDAARVQRWCATRVPERAQHQVRGECDVTPRHITIIERRASWPEDSRVGVDPLSDRGCATPAPPTSWSLYWRDRNLRFHAYDRTAPSPTVEIRDERPLPSRNG